MQTANVLALEKQIREHEPKLLALPEEVAHRRLGDGLWSGLEILGHLSDSAAMNRQRIVRAHYEAPYDFPFYDQPQWVQIQAYEAYDWGELVSLCIGEYRHVLDVLEHLPDVSIDLRCPIKFGSSDYVSLD
jgi:hypothetical protein